MGNAFYLRSSSLLAVVGQRQPLDIIYCPAPQLARQGWRLIQNPEILSARILKAMYFPEIDFMHAELGAQPSKVWRSIMEGCVVLATGLIRRIGTWEDTDA
jgi:hypothetical protein